MADSTEVALRRPPSRLAVGAVVWLASELMFFGGLFAAYFTLRAHERIWPARGVHLETGSATISTFVLVASSVTIWFAGQALERRDRRGCERWLVITLVLGALFLANQVRELFVLDFSWSSSPYSSIYYLMIGFHGAHVAAGLVLLGIAIALVTGPGPVARRVPAFEAVSYYWHFVDVVWIGLFLTIFLVR